MLIPTSPYEQACGSANVGIADRRKLSRLSGGLLAAKFPAAAKIGRDGALSFMPLPTECRVLVQFSSVQLT